VTDAPVFTGTLDEVQEHFAERQWTDGLPIIPPTRAAVNRFLDRTTHVPDEVLGVLGPANREATVETVAVNAVMAGCLPEHMPILVAAAQAVADPAFRIQDGGSTPGWEPLIILSGPIVDELDFNTGAGVMRVGRRANAAVGRFLKLLFINVAGLRIPPGSTDRATIGSSFNVVLPENEHVVRELGWPTFAQERGFADGANLVTVQSVIAASMPTYSAGTSAADHARIICEVIGRGNWAYYSYTGLHYGEYFPLLLLTPSVARAIAADGWTKDDVRRYLGENVLLAAEAFERYAFAAGLTDFNLRRMVDDGRLPPTYAESDDPERLLPCLPKPEMIGIVVSGDAHRNQSKGFVQNQKQGMPVSRLVEAA
jgi:hypothetical protein